jgi:hypothetical protein
MGDLRNPQQQVPLDEQVPGPSAPNDAERTRAGAKPKLHLIFFGAFGSGHCSQVLVGTEYRFPVFPVPSIEMRRSAYAGSHERQRDRCWLDKIVRSPSGFGPSMLKSNTPE